MKLRYLGSLLGLLTLCFTLPACGDDDDGATTSDSSDDSDDSDTTADEDAPDSGVAPDPAGCPDLEDREEILLKGEIDEDTTWTCDNLYILTDLTFIVDDSTLTIEPGTVVQGDDGAALVATVGSRLVAEGQADAPIVFTSSLNEGDRKPGDWGGLVLLGAAPINISGGSDNVEGIVSSNAAGEYGGDDEEHDCGRLKYVRVEWAGNEISQDNELNGISVAGCGSKTTLDYVQVHRGSDDGIEFWGGSARASHIVLSGIQDDSIDWDSGYQGKLQFVVVQQHSDGDSIIEADNGADNNDAMPRSMPTLYNATLVGGGGNGVVLRVGTWGTIRNTIITGAPYAVDVRDGSTADGTKTDPPSLNVANSIFFDNGEDGTTHFTAEDNADGFEEQDFFGDDARDNQFDVDPKLGDIASLVSPDFVPSSDSPASDGAATPPDDGFFDTNATFIGAFEPGGEDWTAGWTAYPEN